MSDQLERRVQLANLLTREGQLELLFDTDLSQRLLSDVRSKKESRMAEPESSQQTPTDDLSKLEQTISAPSLDRKPSKRPALAWTVVAVLIAAVVIGWVILADDPPVASPAETAVQTAVEFMDALNAHDAEAMEALSAPGVLAAGSNEGSIESFRSEIEQEGVIGWTYHFTCQVADERPTRITVTCPYSFTNHITDVFDLEPYEGSAAHFRIEDGVVALYSNNEFSDEWQGDGGGLGVFYEWMVENYPEDVESMYYNYTDEANLDLWKEVIPLLLESEGASN